MRQTINVWILINQDGAKAPVAAIGDTVGELEEIGQISDEVLLRHWISRGQFCSLRHANACIVALREVCLALVLVAFKWEDLNDASEDAIDELSGLFILGDSSLFNSWADAIIGEKKVLL